MKSSENTDSYHIKNLYLNNFSYFKFIYNIVRWRGVSKIETVSSYREKRAQKLHKLIEEDSHNFQNFFLAIDRLWTIFGDSYPQATSLYGNHKEGRNLESVFK